MIKSKKDINVYRTGKRGIYHYRFLVRKSVGGDSKTIEIRRSSGKTTEDAQAERLDRRDGAALVTGEIR